MNFLSHFYFDRLNTDANVVMGVVLPDLIKNASKEANLYPQKNDGLTDVFSTTGIMSCFNSVVFCKKKSEE